MIRSISIYCWICALLAVNWAAEASAAFDTEHLLQQRVSVSLDNESMWTVVKLLRVKYSIPVSFIEDLDAPQFSIVLRNVTAAELLDEVAEVASYRWEVVGGRIVLYEDDPRYHLQITGFSIKDVGRWDAFYEYLLYLKEGRSEFPDFLTPILAGNRRARVYSDPVTLTEEGTVLEHLAQLLGSDPEVFFSFRSVPGPNGRGFFISDLHNFSKFHKPKTP